MGVSHDRQRMFRREVAIELLLDRLQLSSFELCHPETAPALGGADQRRVHQLQDGALAEARRSHTYVMAHAYPDPAICRAVKLGVRTIEHGSLLTEGRRHD